MDTPKQVKAVLVYQGGIANVFTVETMTPLNCERNARRLLQSDFRSCEMFIRGMKQAGVLVSSMYCNQVGDITDAEWHIELEDAPFSSEFRPVYNN